nr:hypothetical protein [Tanacetum cinerariifolium]
MRILLLYRGEYSQWVERFINYLEEQTDGEAMINSIKNGDQPLPRVTQVSIAGTLSSEQPPLKDKSMCNKTAKDLWDALARHMLGSEYGEQDRKAAVLYEYEMFKAIEGELDANDAMGFKKKTVVVTSDPLALIVEKTKVSKSKEKVVVSSDSKGSEADDFSELKKITALLAKAFNQRKFYSKPTNNNLRTSSTSQSANKKQEFVKTDDKRVEKKDAKKKRYMSRVKCYNYKKEGHFAKDCKKVKVKDYEYYKTKMLLAKKEQDEQVLLAEDQAWMESRSDSDQEINENMVFMAQTEKVLSDSEASSSSFVDKTSEVSYYLSESKSESEYETLEYYDNTTTYGLFVNDNDDQEIFHECENFLENLIESQIDHNESVVDDNYSEGIDNKDFENQNKDLQDKYDVLKNQATTFEMNNKELNEQLKVLIEKNDDLLAQTKVLKYQLQVKYVVIDTHVECQEKYAKLEAKRYEYMIRYSAYFDNDKQHRKQIGIGFKNPRYFEKAKDLRPSLYDEKVIGLRYTPMFLTQPDEALEIEKFKRSRENKIEFAYDYGNLNASYVNEKINFSDDYFQEIVNPDFEKINSSFQETSSLKPYVSNVILEKIIIDLGDEVVSLLKKEKANLETIESLKSKAFESSENAISELKNQSDCQMVEKECDKVENSKVIAPGMFKLSVSQVSMSKTSCDSKNAESKTKRKRRKRKSSKQKDKQVNNDVSQANSDFVHFLDLDTFSSVRRPKHSVVIKKKKGSSNTSNVDLSSVSHSELNKNVKRYSRKDLFCDSFDENNLFIFDDKSVRISPVSKMPFRKKPRDFMNVRSKSNSNKSLPRTVHSWLPKMQSLAEPVAKWIPKVERQIDKISKTPNLSGPIFKWVPKHMMGNRALLKNFVEKFLGTVRFGNNDFTVIAGYGDVVIGSVTIKKVYYVEDGVDLLTGDRSSNLYTISLNKVASNSLTCLLAKALSSQSWLWHQRLSHLNFATVTPSISSDI